MLAKLLASLVSTIGSAVSFDWLFGVCLLSGAFSSFSTLFSPETTSTTVLDAAWLAVDDDEDVAGGMPVETSARAGAGCGR